MRRTKEEAEKTKEIIIKNAINIFHKKGFFETTLENIAKAAGYTRGAVYWHFKNKEEILSTIIERTVNAVFKMIDEISKLDISPYEKIKLYIKRSLSTLVENEEIRKLYEINLRLDEANVLMKKYGKEKDKIENKKAEFFYKIRESVNITKPISNEDSLAYRIALESKMDGFAMYLIKNGIQGIDSYTIDKVTDIFLNGFLKEATA